MKLSKKLKQVCDVQKSMLKPYDFICEKNKEMYYIKTIKFYGDAIVTFYSRNHLSVKTGKEKNGRFVTKSERIIQLDSFSAYHQKVILFDKQPFKLLQQINESDIVEITTSTMYDYILISKEEELITLLE